MLVLSGTRSRCRCSCVSGHIPEHGGPVILSPSESPLLSRPLRWRLTFPKLILRHLLLFFCAGTERSRKKNGNGGVRRRASSAWFADKEAIARLQPEVSFCHPYATHSAINRYSNNFGLPTIRTAVARVGIVSLLAFFFDALIETSSHATHRGAKKPLAGMGPFIDGIRSED